MRSKSNEASSLLLFPNSLLAYGEPMMHHDRASASQVARTFCFRLAEDFPIKDWTARPVPDRTLSVYFSVPVVERRKCCRRECAAAPLPHHEMQEMTSAKKRRSTAGCVISRTSHLASIETLLVRVVPARGWF